MWSEAGKPTYEVQAWREHGWWTARIVAASVDADPAPINAVSHARTLHTVEQNARDMVATILDAPDDAFDIELEYVLPAALETVVCEAIGARTWLDAARDLWRERSTVAIRTLAGEGLTLSETATLLGLPQHGADAYSDAT